ncbi:MAG: DOMON-like domain-containing protein [Thermodesulfobacteriota bacterium]
MGPLDFSLEQFPGEIIPPDLRIGGTVGLRGDALSVAFALRGGLSGIAIPPPARVAGRKDRLWEETCLELFIGEAGSGGYREINLSPSGHWNVYRFSGYRQGMREEKAVASLPFTVVREPDALLLSLELDLARILPGSGELEIGASAVLRDAAGRTSHWALRHPAPRPDFHRREGFAIVLSREERNGGKRGFIKR